MARTKKEQPNFEHLLSELEQVVTDLEGGRLTLEQMLEKYAAGVELLRLCRGMLQEAAQQLPHDPQEEELWS